MNKAPDYENRDILEARLNLAGERLRTITAGLNLATPPQALQQQVIDAHLPPSLQRLVLFLFANNGTRTDTINAAVSIGNVSDSYTKAKQRQQLKQLELVINCEVLPAVNRFGALTSIGHIFIRPLPDNKLWQPMMAANAG
jgi:hypothetical protein